MHELKVEKTTIGRVDDNAFPIPEASVSSHHCEVLLRGADIVLRDLNSTNGTFIMDSSHRRGRSQTRADHSPGPGGNAPGRSGGQIRRLQETPRSNHGHPPGRQTGPGTSTKIVAFDNAKSGFAKKNNTGTKIFIGVAVAVLLVLIVVLVYLVNKAAYPGPAPIEPRCFSALPSTTAPRPPPHK